MTWMQNAFLSGLVNCFPCSISLSHLVLNGIENAGTDKAVRSHIVIVHPLNERDIIDAFGSQVFVNGLIKLKNREGLDG